MAQRYFMQLAFKGTHFNGWQKQNNAPSVQQAIENALTKLLRQNTEITGAGRTDTGVHARNYIAHFDAVAPVELLPEFMYRLNMLLPFDIAIQKIWPVAANAHARFDALWRTYEYQIITEKDPFETEFCHYIKHPLNVQQMNMACKILFDYTDFTSFCKLHSDNKTNECHIKEAFWRTEGNKLIFTIKSDRFLRNMVRAIVGTLLNVGSGKISIDEFRNIIEQKNRCKAGTSAPAHGLFFIGAGYPGELINGF